MKRKLAMMLVCLMVSFTAAMAQAISGTVVSGDDGQPIIGATVKIKGTAQGTVTDMNGKFTVKVKAGSPLEFSYVGMVSKEIPAKNGMYVTLNADEKVLDEVMVVAYGTQKKSSFTGSAAVVGTGEIEKVQVTNAVDALKGKAAGVQINTSTGQPGSTPTIRIRGVNSINADSDPLIVLDGSPYDGSLNNINPTDIESMTVLKDAASTALYGARGGNGVILITTKSAKKDNSSSITVDVKIGANSKAIPNYNVIDNPAAYYEQWYKGLVMYGKDKYGYTDQQAWKFANENMLSQDSKNSMTLGYNVYTLPQGQYLIGQNGKLNPNATLGALFTSPYDGEQYWLQPDDWNDAIYKNSMRQEYTVSGTGSTDRSNYYVSANYLKNEGITTASDYARFTGRLKADYQLRKWIKIGANMAYTHYDRNYLGDDGAQGGSGNIFTFNNIAPIYPLYIRNAKGEIIYDETSRINRYDYGDMSSVGIVRPYLSQGNPISANLLDTHNQEGNSFNGTATADITLPYGFSFTSINNVYLNEYRYTITTNPFFGQYANLNGQVSKEHDRTWSLNYQQRLNWRGNIGLNNIEAMVGHEYYRTRGYELDYTMSNQFSVYNKELAGCVVPVGGTSSTSDYNTESWLARALYNYDERYFAQASVVYQASSHFAPAHRWGTFWSVGGGWLINKEKWFNVSWVDELKLKASYGENGNDLIGSYRYTTYYDIVNSSDNVSLVPAALGNEEISWEKNAKFNVGVDFSLFNGRLSGGFEYYANTTKDMLSWFPLPPSFGFTGYYANVGNMLNNGFEFQINAEIIRKHDFSWSVYANLTTNHNEITTLPDERKTQPSYYDGVKGYSSGNYFFAEGHSRYTYYTRQYAGVDPETGESMWYKTIFKTDDKGNRLDINGDIAADSKLDPVVIGREATTNYTDADDYLCGDVLPDVYGGFGTSISMWGIDLSADFTYQIGGQVYDSGYASLMGMDRGYGMHVDILNAWTPENKNSDIPRAQFNDTRMAARSDRFLTNASYLCLNNVTVGYTLPKSITSRIGINKLRFYVVGDNLWTWSKRQGLDPRQSITGGSSGAMYSSIRSISGGVTVTF